MKLCVVRSAGEGEEARTELTSKSRPTNISKLFSYGEEVIGVTEQGLAVHIAPTVLTPIPLKYKVLSVACSPVHALFLCASKEGVRRVLGVGSTASGQLGFWSSATVPVTQPVVIKQFDALTPQEVAAGECAIAVIAVAAVSP